MGIVFFFQKVCVFFFSFFQNLFLSMVFFSKEGFFPSFFLRRVFLQKNLISYKGFFRKRGFKFVRKFFFLKKKVVVSYTRFKICLQEVFLLKRFFC